MASWPLRDNNPNEDLSLSASWGRPNFNQNDSVRQIAPGLLPRERVYSPSPDKYLQQNNGRELYDESDLHSVEDEPVSALGYYADTNRTETSVELDSEPARGAHARGGAGAAAAAAAAAAADNPVALATGGQATGDNEANEKYRSGGRRSRLRSKYILLGLLALLLLITIIVVPVAVVTSRNAQAASAAPASAPSQSPTSPDGSSPTSPDGAPASANGAIKGSGIGANATGDPSVVYFQYTNGDIWQTAVNGGTQDFKGKVLSGSGIRNGTPIAAIQYQASNRNVRHIAYIGEDNILRDALQYNGTGDYVPGKLEEAKLEASSSSRVGLAMIPLMTGNKDATTYPLGSVNLYYGGTDGKLHEISISGGASPGCAAGPCIDINDPTWKEQFVFPDNINGDAGVYVGQPKDTSYVICSTVDNKLAWFSKQTYPENTAQWASGAASTGAQLANNASVSLAGSSTVFYQDPSNVVQFIGFAPEANADAPWGGIHPVTRTGAAAGSPLVGVLLDGGKTAGVIVQAPNNSVVQYKHVAASWTPSLVPVN